jgi:putative zinc finger protein
MPHVDEGQLHALLDGAYDEREARSIQEHIAACAECTARLENEQAVRARASAILAGAQPMRLGTPPFEVVIEKANTARPARARIPAATRLAWAASLVLALGLGWFSSALRLAYRRDVEQTAPATRVQSLDAPAPAPPAAPSPSAAPAPIEETRGRVQEAVRAGNKRSAGEAVARVKDMAATIEGETTKEETRRDTVADQRRARALPYLDTLAQRKAVAQARNELVRDEGRVLGVPVPASAVAAGRRRDSDDQARFNREQQLVSLEQARALARRPILIVPDLDVAAVTWSLDGARVVVRVTQRLFDQSLLELTQEPVPMSAAAERVATPQQQQQRAQSSAVELREVVVTEMPVVRRTDGVAGWEMIVLRPEARVTGRANIPPDSLRAIMSRLREAELRR